MSVFLWAHKLTYVSVPKVACTSLKHMLFRIENGFAFRNFRANGRPRHIHNAVYPGYAFSKLPHARIADHVRLTVVRDPVKRLLSCYANRVQYHKELAPRRIAQEFQERGATPTPSLSEFVDKLELYREASGPIRNHSNPLSDSIGRDPSYYEGIYAITDLDGFRQRVGEIIGQEAPQIPRLQTGGPKFSPDDLSAAQRRRIEAFYAEDYAIYGAYF